MSLDGNTWKTWRDHPGFSQRWTGTISDDGNAISGTIEINEDGTWRKDFDLTYTRDP
jgi:hypothetical protein